MRRRLATELLQACCEAFVMRHFIMQTPFFTHSLSHSLAYFPHYDPLLCPNFIYLNSCCPPPPPSLPSVFLILLMELRARHDRMDAGT